MNQGVHTVDLLIAALGRPVEVFAYTGTLAHERVETEDVAVAVVKFESGALGVIHATTAAYPGLSARHFQRRFTTQIGLSPKLYARTTRFDAALTAHRKQPARSWTDIAHEAGYFDQAHFGRDCRELVDAAPSQFTGDWDNIFSLHG